MQLPDRQELRSAPPDFEPTTDTNALYRRALEQAGLNQLIPLLNHETERSFLETLRSLAIRLPEDRWQDFPEIGLRLKRLSQVPGIHGIKDNAVVITAIGKRISQVLLEHPNLFFLITDGAAWEALGEKPSAKKREMPPAASYTPWRVIWGVDNRRWGAAPPNLDLDIVILCQEPDIDLESIENWLAKGQLRRGMACTRVIESKRRTGFTRLEVSSRGTYDRRHPRERYTFLQLAFPENCYGLYQPQNLFLYHLLSRPDCPPPIALIPQTDPEFITAVAIDFFPERESYQAANFFYEDRARHLDPLVYPLPEFAFPFGSWPERYSHFLHQLRTWAWTDSFPLMEINPPGMTVYHLKEALSTGNQLEMRELSRRTASWFYERIISPLAQNPELLGSTPQRVSNARALIETLEQAFNGEPLLTFYRCLPPQERLTGSPVWGMGIFSENGLLPNLGKFLKEDNRQFHLLEIIGRCQLGKGWYAFTEFLFEETGEDRQKVSSLLTPSLLADLPPTQTRDFFLFLGEKVDPRLTPSPRTRETIQERKEGKVSRLLAWIKNSSVPLSTPQVLAEAGVSRLGLEYLNILEQRGEIVNLAATPTPGRTGRRGGTFLWTTPEKEEEFAHLKSPVQRVLDAINGGTTTTEQIMKETGLAYDLILYSLRKLEMAGLITLTKSHKRLTVSPLPKDQHESI